MPRYKVQGANVVPAGGAFGGRSRRPSSHRFGHVGGIADLRWCVRGPFGAVTHCNCYREGAHDMTRIIRFCSAMLHPRRRETARTGVRPCSPVLSLLIVALLVLPSFGHETEHHRITERILNELLDLRDDVDEFLRGNRNPDPDPDPDPVPRSTSSGITHRVTSACRDTVHWRVFQFQSLRANATRLGSWPGGDEVYVLRLNETLEENLRCTPNAYVCYGGRNTRTRGYWGVGIDGNKGCTTCCERCPTSGVTTLSAGRLTCRQ